MPVSTETVQAPWFSPARTLLLTGAGFTQTFGGYLASEMWAAILNQPEIHQHPRLRQRMLRELDYEALYDEVIESAAYSPPEQAAFTTAIKRAYQHLHEALCRSETRHISAASGVCQHFLARFAGRENNERGFIFTLNQDLFVEKFYGVGEPALRIPALHARNWFNGQLRADLTDEGRVQLPDQSAVETHKRTFGAKGSPRFVYVKLHGSYGWRRGDGSDVMVVGTTKTRTIKNEPLLQWYLSLFVEALNHGDRRLLVIGYGFRDRHINDILADAIRSAGLRLFVIAPAEPRSFCEYLQVGDGGVHRGDEIWDGLRGYYRGTVREYFDESARALPPRGQALFSSLESLV